MTRTKRFTRAAIVLLGLAVVGLLLWNAGWSATRTNLASIGGWFFVLLLVFLPVQLTFTVGWWVLLPKWPVKFKELFAIYLAGDSVNYLSPGGVLGEPLKVHLLHGSLAAKEAVPTLVVHKHAEVFSQAVFVACGVITALTAFPLTSGARLAALGGVVFLGALLWLMTWGLLRGSFGPIVRWLSRLPLLAWMERFRAPADELDAELQSYYQRAAGRRRFLISSAWCLLAWCLRTVETYMVLKLFSPTNGWAVAFCVEAVAMALNNAFVWVPGRVGSAEGVRTGVCVLMGLPAAQGVAYGLARRAREVLWAVPGVVFLARRHVHWLTGEDLKVPEELRPADPPDAGRLAFEAGRSE